MTDETVTTPEDFREAVGVLAAELVNMKAVQEAQGKLLQGMDQRIKLLTALVDADHRALQAHGMVPPPQKGCVSVN